MGTPPMNRYVTISRLRTLHITWLRNQRTANKTSRTDRKKLRKRVHPWRDEAKLSAPVRWKIHCSSSSTSSTPAKYMVKRAKRVRGARSGETSLLVILLQTGKMHLIITGRAKHVKKLRVRERK